VDWTLFAGPAPTADEWIHCLNGWPDVYSKSVWLQRWVCSGNCCPLPNYFRCLLLVPYPSWKLILIYHSAEGYMYHSGCLQWDSNLGFLHHFATGPLQTTVDGYLIIFVCLVIRTCKKWILWKLLLLLLNYLLVYKRHFCFSVHRCCDIYIKFLSLKLMLLSFLFRCFKFNIFLHHTLVCSSVVFVADFTKRLHFVYRSSKSVPDMW